MSGKEQPPIMDQKLCVAGCGFFGSSNTSNMCSKCWASKSIMDTDTQGKSDSSSSSSSGGGGGGSGPSMPGAPPLSAVSKTPALEENAKPQAAAATPAAATATAGGGAEVSMALSADPSDMVTDDADSVEADSAPALTISPVAPAAAAAAPVASRAGISPPLPPQPPASSSSISTGSSSSVAASPSPLSFSGRGSTSAAAPAPAIGGGAAMAEEAAGAAVATAAAMEAAAEAPTRPVQKNRKRCFTCHKKVGYTGIACRCNYVFCSLHRYPEQHDCTFDFKTSDRNDLKRIVVGGGQFSKVDRL